MRSAADFNVFLDLQLRSRMQVAENLCSGQYPFQLAVGNDRKLVEVVTDHHFQGACQGAVRHYRAYGFQGAHHVVQRRIRPFGAIRLPNLMGCDQSRGAAVLDHNETAPAGADELMVYEILDGEARVNLGNRASSHRRPGRLPAPALSQLRGNSLRRLAVRTSQ